MKNKKIVFAPSDKVGEDSYELIEKLFGIKGALLTNESTLNDFLTLDEIPVTGWLNYQRFQNLKDGFMQKKSQTTLRPRNIQFGIQMLLRGSGEKFTKGKGRNC